MVVSLVVEVSGALAQSAASLGVGQHGGDAGSDCGTQLWEESFGAGESGAHYIIDELLCCFSHFISVSDSDAVVIRSPQPCGKRIDQRCVG
ncbi:hypothetical protein SALBM311S_03127 [Streptomyces alboniger]